VAIPFRSALRPSVVALFPGTPSQGDTVVLSTDGHLYTFDGSGWVDNGAAGGGGHSGTASVNFSTGADAATVAVTGQAAIGVASRVQAWIRLDTTADHTPDEARVESLKITAGNIVAGTGFTIYADCYEGLATGVFDIDWSWT
jgi:hypothetical protein